MTVTFTDARRSRGEATRKALMDAAESLIAENDSYAVPLREIVKRAGQKNESALQYHFGNLQGLVSAINERRWLETRAPAPRRAATDTTTSHLSSALVVQRLD